MRYNLELEYRIDNLKERSGVTGKKKMFGGICYLYNGNMCFGIHKEFLIIRTSPDKAQELLRSEYIRPFDITGRPMTGWVMVAPEGCLTEKELENWVKQGIEFISTLPVK